MTVTLARLCSRARIRMIHCTPVLLLSLAACSNRNFYLWRNALSGVSEVLDGVSLDGLCLY